MGSTRLFLYSIAISFLLSGCGYAMEEIGIFKTGNLKTNGNTMLQFSEETVTFDLLRRTSLKTCLECHIHRDGSVPVGSPELAYNNRDLIMHEVNSGEMPPREKGYSPLNSCEKKLLQVWFDAQTANVPAPKVKEIAECSGTTAPTTPQDPTTPPTTTEPTPGPQPIDYATLELSFKNLKAAFFDEKCLRCHSSATRSKDPVMDTVADIRVNTGSSEIPNIGTSGAESFLYKITVPGMIPDEIMPPPRAKLGTLSAEESDYLKRWIDAGMPE